MEVAILDQTLAEPWPATGGTAAESGSGAGGGVATGADPTAALPLLPVPFVGRDGVVEKVAGLLAETRVVTVVGMGGMGKTTVALAVAHRLAGEGRRPVHFCELHTDLEARGALERVCRTLSLDPGDDPAAALGSAAPGTLVVLDNAEQVVGLGAALADVVRRPGVTVLVTSRPLRVRDERIEPLGPLSVEADGGSPSPAAALFVARAEQVRPGSDHGDGSAAEHLCSLLDGVPLAIELAANRARVLTVDQLSRRLTDGRGGVLDGRPAGRPAGPAVKPHRRHRRHARAARTGGRRPRGATGRPRRMVVDRTGRGGLRR